MKRQNSAKNVVSQLLIPGTVVFIKSMRLQAKLQPLYHGPYTVESHNEHDKVILL